MTPRADFQARVARLSTDAGAMLSSHAEKRDSDDRGSRRSWWHLSFGVVWGGLLGFAVTYMNQRYDALFGVPDALSPLAVAGVLFFFVSLAALAVVVVSGLIYALVGRFGWRRWSVILGVLVGVGLGNRLAHAALSAS